MLILFFPLIQPVQLKQLQFGLNYLLVLIQRIKINETEKINSNDH